MLLKTFNFFKKGIEIKSEKPCKQVRDANHHDPCHIEQLQLAVICQTCLNNGNKKHVIEGGGFWGNIHKS